jgi:hypothetical protein
LFQNIIEQHQDEIQGDDDLLRLLTCWHMSLKKFVAVTKDEVE